MGEGDSTATGQRSGVTGQGTVQVQRAVLSTSVLGIVLTFSYCTYLRAEGLPLAGRSSGKYSSTSTSSKSFRDSALGARSCAFLYLHSELSEMPLSKLPKRGQHPDIFGIVEAGLNFFTDGGMWRWRWCKKDFLGNIPRKLSSQFTVHTLSFYCQSLSPIDAQAKIFTAGQATHGNIKTRQ